MDWPRFRRTIKTLLALIIVVALLVNNATRVPTLFGLGVAAIVLLVLAIRGAIAWKNEMRELGEYDAEIQNLCPVCGYDLRASPTQCPECGRERNYVAEGGSRI